MKNPVVYYAVIALGIIVLAAGILFLFLPGGHHFRADVGLGAGIVLIIAGIVGMFVLKPKASAQAK